MSGTCVRRQDQRKSRKGASKIGVQKGSFVSHCIISNPKPYFRLLSMKPFHSACENAPQPLQQRTVGQVWVQNNGLNNEHVIATKKPNKDGLGFPLFFSAITVLNYLCSKKEM